MNLAGLAEAFATPPRSAGAWAFWFLNDEVDEAELSRQLEEFAGAGFGGVCPCARVGLPPGIGYLTDRWWQLLRHVVAECARLGLEVILYDEASYPSGSANGAVAAADPEHASRCLASAERVVDLAPGAVAYARPNLGRGLWDRRVATVLTPASGPARLVQPDAAGLVRLDAAELGPGRHRVTAFFDCPSGGTIRGAHAWQDDGSALAPASADLLNPDAVASFLRLTHDAYAAHVGEWFGSTVVAMFTDEPQITGREPRPGSVTWTPGFEHDLARAAGVEVSDALAALPEVFVPGSRWAAAHARAVSERLARVYYGAQRAWCDGHGLALTGHPHEADELRALDAFTWPGQDTVWRWVLPGASALHGPQSAAARCVGSAAALRRLDGAVGVAGRPGVALTEVYGAYGWQLSLDEVVWLANWLAVRGSTDYVLHALFASVRENRAFESEPDLGLHNAWWPHLPQVLRFMARMTVLGRALAERPGVAVAVTDDHAPADEVAPLWRHQVPFVYVALDRLADSPGGALCGDHAFAAVVALPGDADAVRAALPHALVVVADGDRWWEGLSAAGPEVLAGERADLRVREGFVGGERFVLAANEGEGDLVVAVDGPVWDPWTGVIHPHVTTWTLGRRRAVWVGPARPEGADTPSMRPNAGVSVEFERINGVSARPGGRRPAPETPTDIPLGPWRQSPDAPPGDWTKHAAWETFAGTVAYEAAFTLDAPAPLTLDLGDVGELAEVAVNGTVVAHLFWSPYRCDVPAEATRTGQNSLRVRVTNSSANRYEGALRPSGLIGPASLARRS